MRAGYVNNLYGSYGADPLNNTEFTRRIEQYELRGIALNANGPPLGGSYADVATLRDRGNVWAYRDPSWNGYGPLKLALEMYNDRLRYAPQNESLTLCADIEYHDPNYVLAWWLRLRAYVGPWRRLVWTLEPMQGGWFTSDLVDVINSDPNWIVCPQTYGGSMQPIGTPAEVERDITSRGVNPAQVKYLFDARTATAASFVDGCAYTFEKLP